MDNKNVNTTYVPLQPPYQIIKYGHDIGMQIGTLIVTEQVDDKQSFRIKTRSYPVVTYENKEAVPLDKGLFGHSFMEGVVWNRVELKKVSTVCLSNSHLSWSEFIYILWDDNDRFPNTQSVGKLLFESFPKYGVKVDLPTPGEYTIHLHSYTPNDTPTIVSSNRDDCFALKVVGNDDVEELKEKIIMDLTEYLQIISPKRNAKGWKLSYVTDEEKLIPLVEKLNANSRATRFQHTIMGSINIIAIDSYEGNAMDDEERVADLDNLPEGSGKNYFDNDGKIFHDNLDEDTIASTLVKIDRKGLGVKQFTLAVKDFFESIGWLVSRIDTDFVLWMKNHQIVSMKATGLTHISENKETNDLGIRLKQTFQFLNNNKQWEDKDEYYKKGRIKINKGK